MTPRTQSLMLTLLGALLVKLLVSGSYLRYVNPVMRWPLAATAAVLLLLSLAHLLHDDPASGDGPGHRVPRTTWLLLLPVLVVFVVSPPALGSFVAERRANQVSAAARHQALLGPADPVPLQVSDMVWMNQYDGRDAMAGRDLSLTGFVSHDASGHWFLTRIVITCCAADASAYRVRVDGPFAATAPPDDAWVRVVGRYVDPHQSVPRTAAPAVDALRVTPVTAPDPTYE